jgi:hypothetical protein
MEFHIILPRGTVHLFSTRAGRVVDAIADKLDGYTAKAQHEIRSSQGEISAAGNRRQEFRSRRKRVAVEIARLRSIVLYADQLQRMLTTLPGPQGAILESLREMLKDEPCVKDF